MNEIASGSAEEAYSKLEDTLDPWILGSLASARDALLQHTGPSYVSLASTANLRNPRLHIGSIRHFQDSQTQNIIVRDVTLLSNLIDYFEGSVEKVFLDVEKKTRTPLDPKTLELLKHPKVVPFKPNDLAVEAAIELLVRIHRGQVPGSIAIFGFGNIGFKLALALFEHGFRVKIFLDEKHDTQKVLRRLAQHLRGGGAFHVFGFSENQALSDCSVLIGCSNGKEIVHRDHVHALPSYAEVLDVGNGSFSREVAMEIGEIGLPVRVLSIEHAWKAFLTRHLETERHYNAQTRRSISSSVTIISRGQLGRYGDVIVNNVEDPSAIIGVCDGAGDLLYGEEAIAMTTEARRLLEID